MLASSFLNFENIRIKVILNFFFIFKKKTENIRIRDSGFAHIRHHKSVPNGPKQKNMLQDEPN